jgi:uncharacterized GH25 family protein
VRFFTTPAALLLFLIPGCLRAHDFWIEPSSYAPASGELVMLRLRVGASFIGDPVPRDPALLQTFVSRSGKRDEAIPGMSGRDPAGMLRATADCSVVFYESKPREATLTPEKFAQYIREEGLETQIATPPTAPVIDRFSRSAIAILRPAGKQCDEASHPGPVTLQLMPANDPAKSPKLVLHLLYKSKPLSKTTIIAIDRRNPRSTQRAVTDTKGRAQLTLASPGPWLVKAVHLEKQADGSYRSYWASLTFTR